MKTVDKFFLHIRKWRSFIIATISNQLFGRAKPTFPDDPISTQKSRMSPKVARKKSVKTLNWFMLSAVPCWCLHRDNTDRGVKTTRFVCVHSRLDLVINFFCEFPFRCWIQKTFVVLAFFAVIYSSTRQSSHSQWINHFRLSSGKENKMCPVGESDTMSMPLSRFKSEIYRRAVHEIKDKHLCQSVGMLFIRCSVTKDQDRQNEAIFQHICQSHNKKPFVDCCRSLKDAGL